MKAKYIDNMWTWLSKYVNFRKEKKAMMSKNKSGSLLAYAPENHTIPLEAAKDRFLEALNALGEKKKVLALPPDISRYPSLAGIFTQWAWEFFGNNMKAVLPALGTHAPMTPKERKRMFGDIPEELFVDHNWREDIITLGEIPAKEIEALSQGRCSFSWPAQVNRLLVEEDWDCILSLGQVVPHEVIGMANHAKNIFVGTGGAEGIHKSHFLGAVYGMERIMGRSDNPVRRMITKAFREFAEDLPIIFLLTVIGKEENGSSLRGMYMGDDEDCFRKASKLSAEINIQFLDKSPQKIVTYLDPEEFKSTWLGNKAIYRTRMAIATGGELVVLAPGISSFGEDREIDRLIRNYGYRGTRETLKALEEEKDLKENLSAAAHLIHGSSEGRFSITYCPRNLTREEIEEVGYTYGDISDFQERYDPESLSPGKNTLSHGEEVYYIPNPAAGLWTEKDKFYAQ